MLSYPIIILNNIQFADNPGADQGYFLCNRCLFDNCINRYAFANRHQNHNYRFKRWLSNFEWSPFCQWSPTAQAYLAPHSASGKASAEMAVCPAPVPKQVQNLACHLRHSAKASAKISRLLAPKLYSATSTVSSKKLLS
jgi:hypothetical protein